MQHRWKERIATSTGVLAGKPLIAGTRISVELLLVCLAGWRMAAKRAADSILRLPQTMVDIVKYGPDVQALVAQALKETVKIRRGKAGSQYE